MKSREWLKTLPPGEYDLKQLLKIAGVNHNSHLMIKTLLVYYGATISRIAVPKSNLFKMMFKWNGYKEPWKT